MVSEGSPASVRMFQIALVRRNVELIGTLRPVRGSVTRKSLIPWRSGALPVATEVHRSGESIGVFDRMRAQAPSLFRRARFGSRPAAISGSITSQSPPSMPTRTMRAPVSTRRP